LRERVFRTVIAGMDAAEIRGNTGLQDKVQAEVLLEVERLFHDVGLLVRAVTLTWALNDVERDAMQRSAAEREQQMLDYRFHSKKRELQREKEATEFQLRGDLDIEKLKAATEDELKHMILRQELAFVDAREAGVRTQELTRLNHELEVLNVQRRAGYQKALEDARSEVDRTEVRLKLTQLELEIESLKEEGRLRVRRLQEEQNLALAAEARRQQMESLREMGTIELDGRERERRIEREDRLADHEMNLRSAAQATTNEIERLRIQAQMTPDQILAISAGLSPEVARVFADRAKVASIDVEKRESLLREMVQLTNQGRMASEEQARFFFDKAMGAVATKAEPAPAPGPVETIECPGCHTRPPITDRFCRYCGHAVRV
jgi:hypothetical protein